MHICVIVFVVAPQSIDNRARLLRRGRIVEVNQGTAMCLFAQNRKILANGRPFWSGNDLVHVTICFSRHALPTKCGLIIRPRTVITGTVLKSTERKHVVIYWLTPAKAERDLFCDIILILRKQFEASNFDPHLTLLSTPENRRSPENILRQIDAAPIRLSVREIAFSSEFQKTLFVRLKPNKSLQNLMVDLGRATKSSRRRLADPHVSLLYKGLAPSVQKELAATVRLPFQEVNFNSISAVRSVSPIETSADVKAWKVLARKSLRK